MKTQNILILAAVLASLNATAETQTTESFVLTGPVNQALVLPRAKAGLVRVDFGLRVQVNGTLTVNNQSGVAQVATPSLLLQYSGYPFGNSSQFGSWKTWPTGVSSVSGFGFTDARSISYTSNLAPWQQSGTYTVVATAVAGGTLPTGFSASGSVDATSVATVTLTYTYAPLPPAKGGKK